MSKHTPGPWTQAPYSPTDVIAGDKLMVAMAREGLNGIERDQAVANAALIAAAPELLAALQTMVKAFAVYAPKVDGAEFNCVSSARAAIAKAGGAA